PGSDRRPTVDDSIVVHYRGKLMNGRVFEESYGRTPSTFPLRDVNEGWREGLQLIGEGGVIELIVPPELGYGNEGTPDGLIPPDATIYFFVELLTVGPPDSSL